MSLIAIIVTIAIVGALVWLVLQIPMPQIFKNAILVIVSIFVVVYLLQTFGIMGSIEGLKIK